MSILLGSTEDTNAQIFHPDHMSTLKRKKLKNCRQEKLQLIDQIFIVGEKGLSVFLEKALEKT